MLQSQAMRRIRILAAAAAALLALMSYRSLRKRRALKLKEASAALAQIKSNAEVGAFDSCLPFMFSSLPSDAAVFSAAQLLPPRQVALPMLIGNCEGFIFAEDVRSASKLPAQPSTEGFDWTHFVTRCSLLQHANVEKEKGEAVAEHSVVSVLLNNNNNNNKSADGSATDPAAVVSSLGIFSVVVRNEALVALLAHVPSQAMVVGFVVLLPQASQTDVTDLESAMKFFTSSSQSQLLLPVINSVQLKQIASSGASQSKKGTAIRAVGRASTKGAALLTAQVNDIAHAEQLECKLPSLDSEDSVPVLSLMDGVSGLTHVTPMEDVQQHPPSPVHDDKKDVNENSGSQSSSATFGGTPLLSSSNPFILSYLNNNIGVSFQLHVGSAVNEMRFSPFPAVQYTPDPRHLQRTPVITVQRVTELPRGWEQAQRSHTPQAFRELLQHNIVFHMSSWETARVTPRAQELDIAGARAWAFEEVEGGQRCKTFVCPRLQPFDASSQSNKKDESSLSSGEMSAALVKSLLVIRWETPIKHWDDYNQHMRVFLDSLHWCE